MKHLASTFWLSALVLLNGCGGGREDGGNGGGGTPPTSSLNVSGNWQLSTISTVPGMPALEIAGSITQSGNSLNGAVHVDGSDCLDQVTTLHLAGALTGSNATLTSDPVGQQVITLTGSVTKGVLTGTYAIDGGCANGDQGNVSGFRVTPFSGTWRSLFSINDEHYPGITTVTQDSASSEGSFGITGENDDSSNLSCLSGMIKPGTFPSPRETLIKCCLSTVSIDKVEPA
jgi:hypothetical protein